MLCFTPEGWESQTWGKLLQITLIYQLLLNQFIFMQYLVISYSHTVQCQWFFHVKYNSWGVLKVVDVCDGMSVDVWVYDRVLFRVLNHLAHCIYDSFWFIVAFTSGKGNGLKWVEIVKIHLITVLIGFICKLWLIFDKFKLFELINHCNCISMCLVFTPELKHTGLMV